MSTSRIQALTVTLGLVASALLLLPYVELSGVNRGQLNFYSLAEERRLGAEEARRLEARFRLVAVPPIQVYVQQLGTTIASVADTPGVKYEFRMLDTPVVNALALPGGFVYLTRGLVLAARNEGELAGVLAHEISHVASRHGTARLSRDQLIAFLTSLGGSFLLGDLASPLPGLVTNLESLSYTRGDETEADDLATGYLYQAGYHPDVLASFFDRLWRSRQEAHLTRFLMTHPLSTDRAARVRWRISTWPLDDRWTRDSAAFHEVQALLRARAAGR